MNSFNFIARGIEAEVERQIGVWESGGEVRAADLRLRRRDGHAHRAALEGGGRRLPLLPGAGPRAGRACDRARGGAACRASRVTGGSHPPHRARTRSRARHRARHWWSRPSLGRDGCRGRRRRRLGERDREQPRRRRCRSSGCTRRASSRSSSTARDAIPRAAFDEAISKLGEPGFSAESVPRAGGGVRHRRARLRSSTAILEENPGQVAAYRGGKEGLLGFFVGQVMKETQGKANPRVVSELVREKLRP